MQIITDHRALVDFCSRAANKAYITVDTEFLREKTFYAQLCLVQIAYPGEGDETSAVIDVLAEELDLSPVIKLFKNPDIVKVFHAARQDLEIFYHDYGVLPEPFFDTQIAAMVAGFGEQVGYEKLVKAICNGKIDKTSRFTDWRRRPLSETQIEYARADVTYLREIYEHLSRQLRDNGRIAWVEEELSALLDPELYDPDPREAWRKVRTRTTTPRFLAIVRELAEFRENFARKANIPRARVYKDDALLEFAAQRPKSENDMKKLRLWPRDARKGKIAAGAIEAIKRAEELDASLYPQSLKSGHDERAPDSVIDLLKVLLKAQAEHNKVAPSLICSTSDLENYALDPSRDHVLNKGWRNEVFGKLARKLIEGEAALKPNGKYIELIEVKK